MKVSILRRSNKKGKINLSLQIYWGYTTNSEGKLKHKRERLPLDLYLYENTKRGSLEEKHNIKVNRLAENIRAERELKIVKGEYGFTLPEERKIRFLSFFEKVMEEHNTSKSNYDNWTSAYIHIQRYCDKNLLLSKVDVDFVKGIKNYLLNDAYTTGNKKLSQNSAVSYFNKFRCCLNEAFNEGVIKNNPVSRVKGIKAEQTQREYLTEAEFNP